VTRDAVIATRMEEPVMDDDDFELDLDFATEAEALTPAAPAPRRTTKALVVEDDPKLARICSKVLGRLGVRAEVVWTREDALSVLSRAAEPLAFAFLDSLRDDSCRGLADEARRLRPGMPVLGGTRAIDDVLVAEAVVICTPFTSEEFEAAFDAALLEERIGDALREAADRVRLEPPMSDEELRAAGIVVAPAPTPVEAPPPAPLPISA
jgi:DNA-binding response OmpR family regulator